MKKKLAHGILERYQTAVETAVDYLLKSRISQRPYAQAALLAARNPIKENFKWKAGTFFCLRLEFSSLEIRALYGSDYLGRLCEVSVGWQKNDKSLSEMIEKITVDL